MIRWDKWFYLHGHPAMWLSESPTDQVSKCDRCGKKVWIEQPRLRWDNGQGPKRKFAHGKQNEYLCLECANRVGAELPPPNNKDDQDKLFDT